MIVICKGSIEWEYMWESLSLLEINAGDKFCLERLTGETWEYLGTFNNEHTFRHRLHPKTNQREDVKIPLSDSNTMINRPIESSLK